MFALLAEIETAPGYFVEFETGDIWSLKGSKPARLSGGISKGYRIYSLSIGGRCVTKPGHRLVASTAYGPCPEGYECRHINGNRTDNRALNLAWGTSSQNNGADKLACGRLKYGETHQNSKLTYSDVETMRLLRRQKGTSFSVLAKQFGVTAATVHKIINYKAWVK